MSHLARALAFDPEILFFDEPLSAIDYKLRKTLEKELKDIHRETGKTFVYITHSLEEAMVMSDRIGVMRAGKLVQVGTPNEIYSAPRDKFVSEFMGDVNVIPVSLAGGNLISASFDRSFKPPAFPTASPPAISSSGRNSCASSTSRATPQNSLSGRLYNEYALGSRIQYQIRAGEHVFIVEKLRQQAPALRRDQDVLIGWDAEGLHPGERLMAGFRERACRSSSFSPSALPRRLLAVIGYSFMPERSFGLVHAPTLENYVAIFNSNSYISFGWSLLFAALTVAILALICYPIAYGLARVFGRWAPVITLLFTIPLFVSENVRLYGWILFFIKNGVLLGTLKSLFGLELDSWLFTRADDPARHGLCLFALHAVPDDARRLHGAERNARGRPRSRRLALAGLPRSRTAPVHAGHHDRLSAHLRARRRRHRGSEDSWRPDHHPDHP